jgi:hypothetical protein
VKVRLMIGGLSNCPAVSLPQNRAKSENHPTQSGDVSPATAKRQRPVNPAEASGVELPQARRRAETEVVTRAGPRQRRPRYQLCKAKGAR